MCNYLQFESIFNLISTNATFQSTLYIYNNDKITNISNYKYNITPQNKTSMIELITNKPPSNGRCIANKNEGIAIIDRFNVTCNCYTDTDTSIQSQSQTQTQIQGLKYYFINHQKNSHRSSIEIIHAWMISHISSQRHDSMDDSHQSAMTRYIKQLTQLMQPQLHLLLSHHQPTTTTIWLA